MGTMWLAILLAVLISGWRPGELGPDIAARSATQERLQGPLAIRGEDVAASADGFTGHTQVVSVTADGTVNPSLTPAPALYAFVRKWGSHGTGDGQFDFTVHVAVDAAGNVYLADTYNHRIQVFKALPRAYLPVLFKAWAARP